MPNYYKFLNEDGSAVYGYGTWSLPNGDTPGDWMPHVEELISCKSGYHLCRTEDLVIWMGPRLFVAEVRGDVVESDDKIVCHQARLIKEVTTWNKTTAQQFAIECANHVLHIFEKAYPDDNRPRRALEVAQRFLDGDASEDELRESGDDARTAPRDAASDAAWWASRAVGDAASDAAWDAWYSLRAAWAAWDAWDASRAAWWAARAAGDAEHEWQTKLLLDMLKGDQYA
jgi:hypothetical protein